MTTISLIISLLLLRISLQSYYCVVQLYSEVAQCVRMYQRPTVIFTLILNALHFDNIAAVYTKLWIPHSEIQPFIVTMLPTTQPLLTSN
jgi:hypothetical protein